MPLNTDIDCLALGEISSGDRHYVFLLEPASGRLVAAARYEIHERYFECVNLVSDGYGPTMFILLLQKARREGLRGVAPDLHYNSDEAKRMNERLYLDVHSGVHHLRNDDAHHAEDYLNQIYFLTEVIIDEAKARENAERYFAAGQRTANVIGERSGLADHLERYLFKSELPFK